MNFRFYRCQSLPTRFEHIFVWTVVYKVVLIARHSLNIAGYLQSSTFSKFQEKIVLFLFFFFCRQSTRAYQSRSKGKQLRFVYILYNFFCEKTSSMN